MAVKRFVTKRVEIEAIQFDGENHDELKEWTGGNWDDEPPWNMFGDDDFDYTAQVYDILHDTWIQVKPGQWIVRGVKGEFYPCDDETFHWKYEEVQKESSLTMHDLRRAYEE
jgi:hypothetical protein